MAGGISWHYVLKFIITGDAAVGKSSLLVRLTDQRFLANPDPTLGVEFGTKLMTIAPAEGEAGTPQIVKLQCWDTAGTESFRSITRSYYRGAAGCLLVYDVTSRASFTNARSWLADVREHADPHLTCILVGNKLDLVEPPAPTSTDPAADPAPAPTPAPNPRRLSKQGKPRAREVPTAEAAAWAEAEGLLFVESSAKSGAGVEAAFEAAARDILGKIARGVWEDERSAGVKLSKPVQGAPGEVRVSECS
ncbi:hypothetical protein HWV62_5724 [Athelia sp. TMB]|nr:hypothetical protein HWV62_5724 [Athelia sp. TMB]